MDAAVGAAIVAAGVAGAHVPPAEDTQPDSGQAAGPADSPDAGPAAASPSPSTDSRRARDPGFDRPSGPEVFSLSFLPDFSHGIFSSHRDHVISVNVLAGTSGSSYGFEVGGLANFESGEVIGFQAAGLVNASIGSVTGYQSAGLVNYTGGDARFFQSAGLVNVVGGLLGGQAAGLANVSLGTAIGGQVAGIGNWTGGDVIGAQVAGVGNWAANGVSGAQVSGVFNYARSVRGPQISVVNISDSVYGAQVGVVNIAGHVSGTQVGVLNISREIDGVPIGLLSIEKRGRHALDLWMDSDGVPSAALSLGTRYLYTVFSAGWSPSLDPTTWSLGVGLGGRAQIGRAFVDVDLAMVTQRGGASGWDTSTLGWMYPRARAVAGWNLSDWFAVEAGVSVRALVPTLSDSIPGADPLTTKLQPAFIAGVHLG
jgi:hypothetical protein